MAAIYGSLSDPLSASGLSDGQVGVIPTDTVYGLVAVAAQPEAVKRLYGLKQREHKPGTIIAADIEQLVKLGMKERYLRAVANFWPNPISIVIPFSEPSTAYLRQGLLTIAVRLPKEPAVTELLRQTGPLLTTSANQPGQPPAGTVEAAMEYFNDSVDFYVDGGDLSQRQPSTIIRMVDDAIEVLREGAVKVTEKGEIKP